MSSVSNDANEAQKVREYYKEREQTLKEQHQKEIAKMQNAHKTDVREVNATNDERINRASKNTQATIERRDMRHQREMNELKKIHSEQRKQQSLERMNTEKHLNETYQDQITSQERVHKAQMQNVREKSSQNLMANNESTGEILEQYQQRNQEESQISRNRLNRVHHDEKRDQQTRHREEMNSLVHKSEGFKQNKEQEIAALKRNHRFEVESLNRKHQIAMEDQKYQEAETMKDVRDEYDLGIKKIQKKYDKSLQREKNQLAETRNDIYGQQGRVARERDRQNQKIRNLGDDNVRDRSRMGAQKRRELDNLRLADKDAYDKLYEQRNNELKTNNKIHGQELSMAKSNADQRINANYEYYKKKMEVQDTKNNHNLTSQRRKLITENNDRRKENEMHLNQLQDNYANDREKLLIAHTGEKQRLQDRQTMNLEQTRFKDETERAAMRQNFEEKIKELDLAYKNDLMDLNQQHDKKLIEVRGRQQQQIVELKQESERLQMERERAYAMREANREAKFKHRIKNMETQHAEQLKIRDTNYKQNLSQLMQKNQSQNKQKA